MSVSACRHTCENTWIRRALDANGTRVPSKRILRIERQDGERKEALAVTLGPLSSLFSERCFDGEEGNDRARSRSRREYEARQMVEAKQRDRKNQRRPREDDDARPGPPRPYRDPDAG